MRVHLDSITTRANLMLLDDSQALEPHDGECPAKQSKGKVSASFVKLPAPAAPSKRRLKKNCAGWMYST